MSRARTKRGRSDAAPASGVHPVAKVGGLAPAVAEELDLIEKGLLVARRQVAHMLHCLPIGVRSQIDVEYDLASEALTDADGALGNLRYELERQQRVAS